MKIIQKLLAIYQNDGHYMYPEDTWDLEYEIENKEDLLKMLKEIYRRNASSHNNYPMNGSYSSFGFNFCTRNEVTVNGELFKSEDYIEVDKPSYFNDAFDEMDEFVKRVRSLVPKLHAARDKKRKEEREREAYLRLKMKYEDR